MKLWQDTCWEMRESFSVLKKNLLSSNLMREWMQNWESEFLKLQIKTNLTWCHLCIFRIIFSSCHNFIKEKRENGTHLLSSKLNPTNLKTTCKRGKLLQCVYTSSGNIQIADENKKMIEYSLFLSQYLCLQQFNFLRLFNFLRFTKADFSPVIFSDVCNSCAKVFFLFILTFIFALPTLIHSGIFKLKISLIKKFIQNWNNY